MSASPETQLQICEDAHTEHTDGETSPSICHLLDLPPELHLLIYEAYFGSTKMRELYLGWGQKLELLYNKCNHGYNPNIAALLRSCKRIHDEALPVHDANNVPLLVHCRWGFRSHPNRTTKLLDQHQLHFLKQVSTVQATLWGSDPFYPSSVLRSMQEICESLGWGKDMKSITFTTERAAGDLWTSEENEELEMLVARLQCPSNIEGLRQASR
ncbi:hypothetical protein LTR15_012581 [Elasticomyces elasticus]|nr:hypothetical protein LTR15_012581 [Elasticomyces elasticus]